MKEKKEKLLPRVNFQKEKYRRKIGRNEICPCGSGKKYKECCLKKDKEEK